jgi:hypothetical protein
VIEEWQLIDLWYIMIVSKFWMYRSDGKNINFTGSSAITDKATVEVLSSTKFQANISWFRSPVIGPTANDRYRLQTKPMNIRKTKRIPNLEQGMAYMIDIG